MNINFKRGYFYFIFLTKSDWTLSSESMDNVQSVHGLSGHCPWTLSSPPGLPGLCPGCQWTMSRLSTESMDNVHWVHGQCPLNPWTLSSLAGLTGLCPWTHWTLSRISMDTVQTVHWDHGKCPLSPWTMSRMLTKWFWNMKPKQCFKSHFSNLMDAFSFSTRKVDVKEMIRNR